eukprot:2901522-Ditylum_brightwellii.AAC.1
MMSHVLRRAREVCAPALATMKQRQVELKQKLAEKNTSMDTPKAPGNEQINNLRNKQDLLEKNFESRLASLDVDSDDDDEFRALEEKLDQIAQKNKELEEWRVSFDKNQQERFDWHAENVAKQLYEHSEEINNKLESHHEESANALLEICTDIKEIKDSITLSYTTFQNKINQLQKIVLKSSEDIQKFQ